MSGLKNRFKNKFDSVWGRNKQLDGDVYIKLEKDCENVRKAASTLKKGVQRYVESKPSIKERLLSETKQDTMEFCISSKISSVAAPLTGITSQFVDVVVNTFKELSDHRHQLESFFNDKSKLLFDKHYEDSLLDIKRTARIVNSARANAYAIKNNKKATEEMIHQSTYNYELEKINRQNLMLDYCENDHVARVEILLELYEKLVEFHLECSDLFKRHLDSLNQIKKDAITQGLQPHYPLPDPNKSFSLRDSMISFSDDANIDRHNSTNQSMPDLTINSKDGVNRSHSLLDMSHNSSQQAPHDDKSNMSLSMNNPFVSIEQEANTIVEESKVNDSNTSHFAPETKTYAIVHFDFEAECNDELTVKAGNEVIVIRTIDQDWVLAEFNGKRGYVPITYIQIKK